MRQISLSYVSSNKLIDNFILGIDSLLQLKKILNNSKKIKFKKKFKKIIKQSI
jgi:hypothetical protein